MAPLTTVSQFDASFTARSATASCEPDGTLGVYVQLADECAVATRPHAAMRAPLGYRWDAPFGFVFLCSCGMGVIGFLLALFVGELGENVSNKDSGNMSVCSVVEGMLGHFSHLMQRMIWKRKSCEHRDHY